MEEVEEGVGASGPGDAEGSSSRLCHVLVVASAMGLLWLSTVPLTTGLIAQIFGPRYMATLAAIAFVSHQFGSFLGVWLGGLAFDRTGSYDSIWTFAILAGFAATIIHLPIPDKPLVRAADGAA